MGIWGLMSPEHYRLMRALMVLFLVSGVGVGLGFAADALSLRWLFWVAYAMTASAILCAGVLIMRDLWRRLNAVVDFLVGERRAK